MKLRAGADTSGRTPACSPTSPRSASRGRDGADLRHGRQHVLGARQAAVEQRQARQDHHQHEHGGGHHPGGVALVRRSAAAAAAAAPAARHPAPRRAARRRATHRAAGRRAIFIIWSSSSLPRCSQRGLVGLAGADAHGLSRRRARRSCRRRSRRCWPTAGSPRPRGRRGRSAQTTSIFTLGTMLVEYSAPR